MAARQERNITTGVLQNKAMAGLLGLAVLSAGCSLENSNVKDDIAAGQTRVPSECSAVGGEAAFTLRVAMGISVEMTSELLGDAGPERQATAWQKLSAEVGRVVVQHSGQLDNVALTYRVGHDGEAPFAHADAEAASDQLTAELGRVTGFPTVDDSSYFRAQDRIATLYVGSLEATQAADCSRL